LQCGSFSHQVAKLSAEPLQSSSKMAAADGEEPDETQQRKKVRITKLHADITADLALSMRRSGVFEPPILKVARINRMIADLAAKQLLGWSCVYKGSTSCDPVLHPT
jgi:hypothetical protein